MAHVKTYTLRVLNTAAYLDTDVVFPNDEAAIEAAEQLLDEYSIIEVLEGARLVVRLDPQIDREQRKKA